MPCNKTAANRPEHAGIDEREDHEDSPVPAIQCCTDSGRAGTAPAEAVCKPQKMAKAACCPTCA